jgi:hypothetical protein
MPSTFTSNGGIELPANGEQDGIWGDTVNDNMRIIDRLTNGVGAIALSGTTHTLTTLDGDLSDGHYAVLVFGGSPSGTNTVTISPNDAQHVYIVRNTTAQSIVLTQGSGSDVTVAAGRSAIIACDGAGSGAAVTDVTAGFAFQASSAALTAIAGLAVTDGNFIVGNGTTWVAESGNTVLTSLGVTATTAELNILDGVTATTAELNILDGVTATTAELNILDGVTATTAELNYNDITTLGTSEASKVLTADSGGKVLINGAQRGNIVAVAALDIDCSAGNYFTKTISANSTFTFSNVPSSSAYAFTLELTHTSGTVTWPVSVEFPSGIVPILTTGKTHLFVFVTDDGGTRWRGAALVDYTN